MTSDKVRSDHGDSCSSAFYGEDDETDYSALWREALARNCSHDGLDVRKAAQSGASLIGQFMFLLVGPLSAGSMLVLLTSGASDALSSWVVAERQSSTEVVAIPDSLIASLNTLALDDAVPIPDFVPHTRRMMIQSAPSEDVKNENISSEAIPVTEVVVVVPRRITESTNRAVPSPPTALQVE